MLRTGRFFLPTRLWAPHAPWALSAVTVLRDRDPAPAEGKKGRGRWQLRAVRTGGSANPPSGQHHFRAGRGGRGHCVILDSRGRDSAK